MADKHNPEQAKEFLHRLRHSAAHVMAEAVLGVYPEAKIAIGPAIDTGFYYDFDLGVDAQGRPRTFAPEDLAEIEKRMRQIIAGKHPFAYREVSADEARAAFRGSALQAGADRWAGEGRRRRVWQRERRAGRHQHLPPRHLRGSVPRAAPRAHRPDPAGRVQADDAWPGAYWRGDEHNPMLQRIYGTAWRNKKELSEYLQMLEEAKKRDHRKLGKELEIFIFDDEVGPGLPLWLPNGGDHDRGAGEAGERDGAQGRLPAGAHAAPGQGRSLPAQRPPALLRREHVSADGAGGGALLRQADELPDAPQDLRQPGRAAIAICRCAWPSTAPATATRRAASCSA